MAIERQLSALLTKHVKEFANWEHMTTSLLGFSHGARFLYVGARFSSFSA